MLLHRWLVRQGRIPANVNTGPIDRERSGRHCANWDPHPMEAGCGTRSVTGLVSDAVAKLP